MRLYRDSIYPAQKIRDKSPVKSIEMGDVTSTTTIERKGYDLCW